MYIYRSKASAGPVKEPEFIPSPEFTGSILGMVYKHDAKGLGYYKDASYKHKGALSLTSTQKTCFSSTIVHILPGLVQRRLLQARQI